MRCLFLPVKFLLLRSTVALATLAPVQGCTANEVTISIGGPDLPHQAPNISVKHLSDAIEYVRRDIAARKASVIYMIELKSDQFELDAPLTISELRQPHGSRVIVRGSSAGARVSGGFQAGAFLKPTQTSAKRFQYSLALADLPTKQQQALSLKLSDASPQELMIRMNGSKFLRPTRWPSNEFTKVVEPIKAFRGELAAIHLSPPLPDMKTATPGLWLGGYLTDSYLFVNAPVKAADAYGIWLERSRLRSDGKPPERIYLYNIKSFIKCDSFFFDPHTRTIHFCSESPIKTLEISGLSLLLDVSHSENITFQNLRLELSLGAAASIRDSSGINFRNITVDSVAGDGIAYARSSRSTVSHATIRNVGASAIRLNGGVRENLTRGDLILEDSLLEDFSQIQRTFTPAVHVEGVGAVVRRNVIFNGPQFGIMYSGNGHLFEDNVMAQLILEAGDSGFFYTGRDLTSHGNSIRRNILIGTSGQYLYDPRGIYLDELSSGNLVTENVIVGIPYGILTNGGKDNSILSNLLMLSTPSIWASALGYAPWWQKWRNDHMKKPDGLTVKNLYSFALDKKPWSELYPKLQTYIDSDLLKPERIRIEDNVFLGGGVITAFDENMKTADLTRNTAIVYQGTLRLLERLRNPIEITQLDDTIAMIADEITRHGLRNFPLRRPHHAGATFSSRSAKSSPAE